MIYAKTKLCNKHHWLLYNKPEEAIMGNLPLDIYKTDRDDARQEIRELLEKEYDINLIKLEGNERDKIKNTINIIESQDNVLIENAFLKNKNNDYYIKYDFILKKGNELTIFFILYKDLDKAVKDYNTKLSLIPKILYSTDIIRSNFTNYYIKD